MNGEITVGDVFCNGNRRFVVTRVPQKSSVEVDIKFYDLQYFEHGTSDSVNFSNEKIFKMRFVGNIMDERI